MPASVYTRLMATSSDFSTDRITPLGKHHSYLSLHIRSTESSKNTMPPEQFRTSIVRRLSLSINQDKCCIFIVARVISVNNVIIRYTVQKANACSSFLFQL